MKTSTTKKEYAFKEAATLVTGAVFTLAALLFTGCPNAAGGGGGGTPIINYVPVSYDKLEEYLTNQASGSEVTYIELTGAVPPADLKGSPPDASSLGQKLAAAAPKKIGLKLPASAASATDMSGCFTGCTNLVNVASLPRDLTDMSNCFKGCTALETVDAVPSGVTNMQHCFDGCTNLKSVTLKCTYNSAPIGSEKAFFAAFKNCTALKARSITVPYGTLGAYTDSTACIAMAVQADRFAEAAAEFVQVDYANLDTHLTHNLTVGINCIELTGTIPLGDLTGTSSAASALGQKLKDKSPKQFALKLTASIAGLTDMSYCFNGCTNLVSLATIPASVMDMTGCFSGCSALQTAPAIPKSVTDMNWCFNNCTGLTQAPTLPKGVTDIGHCFFGCTGLTEVPVIPASVTRMEDCFNGCTALTGAALKCDYDAGNFDRAFSGCDGLPAGSIRVNPSQLSDYQNNAATMGTQFDRFVGDDDLFGYVKVTYTNLYDYLIYTASATDINYIEITDISAVSFTDSGSEASYLGKTLKSAPNKKVVLRLPASVSGLTDMSYCFYGCTNLVSLATIPESVTNMKSCFYGCTGLTEVPVIPVSVTKMEDCFNGCTALTGAALKCDYDAGNFDRAFSGCDGLPAGSIRVNPSQLSDYQNNAATMGTQFDRFVGDDDLFGYVKVTYTNLYDYLIYTASATDINYIEITDISAVSFTGSDSEASYLGETLKRAPNKKVVLKLPASVSGLTDMTFCFLGCSNLVGLAAIPQGVTNMKSCFYNCTGLTKAPVIPASVTDMQGCFYRCIELTAAPVIPASVTDMQDCFYRCIELTAAPVIHDGVINMKECFKDCSKLVSVPRIPATVTNMDSCFYNCSKIVNLPVIPASVKNLNTCFYQCTRLTGITLRCNYGDGEFYHAFQSCWALTTGSIKVPRNQLQTYKDHAGFMGVAPKTFAAE